jgi:hypothetical protein
MTVIKLMLWSNKLVVSNKARSTSSARSVVGDIVIRVYKRGRGEEERCQG